MLKRGRTGSFPVSPMVRSSTPLRLALVALVLVACEELPTGPPSGSPPAVRGMTLVSWTRAGYAEASALRAIEEIARLGATHVALVPTGYQRGASASTVEVDPVRTPSLASVESAIGFARARGLQVVVKPHVDLEDGRWRGDIAPADPAAWFESYEDFLVPWADLAQRTGASTFVVGTELAGTIEHEDAWKRIIAAVRARFTGSLLYAASWDEVDRVGFWSCLDGVGVDVYVPVTIRLDPGRLEILARWQPWLARLRRLHQRTGRPVFFTEIGYRSVDGAGMRPYDFQRRGKEDEIEQADLYWAALAATVDQDWIGGVLWWNWRADGAGGPGDADYTIRGKLAAEELAATWSGL